MISIKGEKNIILLLKTNWSLFVYSLIFTQEFFVLSLVEIGPVVLENVSNFLYHMIIISSWKRE